MSSSSLEDSAVPRTACESDEPFEEDLTEEARPPEESSQEQKLWVPLYFYLGAVLVYGLSEIGGNLERKMPPHTAWLFVPAMLYLAVGALASGKVPLRGEPIYREQKPGVYWTVVSVYFACAAALALFGAGLLAF